MEEEKKVAETKEDPDNNIVVDSLEDDMRSLGIEVSSGNDEKKDNEKEEQPNEKEEQPKANDNEQQPKQKGQPDKKKKSRAQRRIEYQQRKIRELEAKLQEKEKEQSHSSVKEDNDNTDDDDDEINEEDYDSYEDYLIALQEKEEKANKDPEKKTDNNPDENNHDESKQETIKSILTAGEESYDDFKDVVMRDDLPISQQLADTIIESEYAPDILYYLGKNEKVASKLSSINDTRKLEKEIIKLEVKIEESSDEDDAITLTTKAPEPINPVKGSATEVKSLDDDINSFEEYENIASKVYQKRRRDGFL